MTPRNVIVSKADSVVEHTGQCWGAHPQHVWLKTVEIY